MGLFVFGLVIGLFGLIGILNLGFGFYIDLFSINFLVDLIKGSVDEDLYMKCWVSLIEFYFDVRLGGEGGFELFKWLSFKKMKLGIISGWMGRKLSVMWKGMEEEVVVEEVVMEELKN